MNYEDVLTYLYSSLPMYQRIGGAAYKADLHNTLALMDLLDKPYTEFNSIHIAGTNGKGSTSHCLASILQSSQVKTALYTSPHLKDFRERIRIDGKMINEKDVTLFIEKYKTELEKIGLSFFEMTVGLAFDYFRKEKVEMAVVEVGMGGRLDSTNVLLPELCLITNIGLDHTTFLGDTLEKIAFEKAGIIKPSTPIIISETKKETKDIFIQIANEKQAPLYFADQRYEVRKKADLPQNSMLLDVYREGNLYLEDLHFPLSGLYQLKNLAGVFQAAEILSFQHPNINKEAIREGLERVLSQTGLMGRWQVLHENPLAICDTGHNPDGIRYLMDQLKLYSYERLHFVLGVVNDKDLQGILPLLPKDAQYYFCKPNIPRGLETSLLKEKAKEYALDGKEYGSVQEAYQEAISKAAKEDMIFVGGSTFVVAEVC